MVRFYIYFQVEGLVEVNSVQLHVIFVEQVDHIGVVHCISLAVVVSFLKIGVLTSPSARAYGQDTWVLEVSDLIVVGGVVLFGITAESGHTIRDLMLPAGAVNNREVERRKLKSPPHESSGRIFDGHQPAEQVIIRTNGEARTIYVWG